MNNYFSDLISKLGGGALGLTAYDETPVSENSPLRISFITLYNPSWAKESDESLEGLSHQILFFVTPQTLGTENNVTEAAAGDERTFLREQLNLVGLIRGSCSLLLDFGSMEGPITIETSDGALVVIEIAQGYFLAVSLLCKTKDKYKLGACVKQVTNVIEQAQRYFELMHLPLENLVKRHGKGATRLVSRSHWLTFLQNYNLGADIPFGPGRLVWPHLQNHRGFFEFLPNNCHKRSSLKFPRFLRKEMDDLVLDSSDPPTGYFIAGVGQGSIKHSGVLHLNLGRETTLDEKAVVDLYKLFEDVNANCMLTPEFFVQLTNANDIQTLLGREWKRASDIAKQQETVSQNEDSEDESLSEIEVSSASAALAMLNPVRLTNSLVVQPINGTVNGFMNLGMAVTEQIYEAPNWFNRLNYFGGALHDSQNTVVGAAAESDIDGAESGEYLIGLVGERITRFLVYIPTTSGNGLASHREYLVIAYKREGLLAVLIYESGSEVLESPGFYSDLKASVLEPLIDLSRLTFNGSAPLSNSISSLPAPIEVAVHGAEGVRQEIDSEFFFVIYDTEKHYYETSLPNLLICEPTLGVIDKHKQAFMRVIFHLHDHLITHFILETRERIFRPDGIVYEQLHKFPSSKNNDWLIYSMRHKAKVILVIKDNHKPKAQLVTTPTTSGNYLLRVTDGVYGAANFGFLESLGGDVRVWLGGVSKESDDS